jgi:hypothetical protein
MSRLGVTIRLQQSKVDLICAMMRPTFAAVPSPTMHSQRFWLALVEGPRQHMSGMSTIQDQAVLLHDLLSLRLGVVMQQRLQPYAWA